LLAASSAEVAAIDTVFPNFRDMAAFEAECRDAVRDGFTGKMAIHPGPGARHQRHLHAII
jgi:citrate lyase subunit beta/citryl-CoA lyase